MERLRAGDRIAAWLPGKLDFLSRYPATASPCAPRREPLCVSSALTRCNAALPLAMPSHAGSGSRHSLTLRWKRCWRTCTPAMAMSFLDAAYCWLRLRKCVWKTMA